MVQEATELLDHLLLVILHLLEPDELDIAPILDPPSPQEVVPIGAVQNQVFLKLINILLKVSLKKMST